MRENNNPPAPGAQWGCYGWSEGYFFSAAFDFSAVFSFALSAFVASAFDASVLAVSLLLDSEALADLPESEALVLVPLSAG